MICAAGAIMFSMLMYDPRDGHLEGVHDYCSRQTCEEAKRIIVQQAPPRDRNFLRTHNRCLRK